MTEPNTAIVADIGGTNIRLGLVTLPDGAPQHIQSLSVADFAGLTPCLEHYLQQVPGANPSQLSIVMANPITGDEVNLTNRDWGFSVSAVGRHFGFKQVKVINDFTGLALSIPLLKSDELQQVGSGQAKTDGDIALLGAGTGLGVSGLIHAASGWYPIQGEGGHVTLGAGNARELALFGEFIKRYSHMSAERLLSGTGLGEAYEILQQLDGLKVSGDSPAQITAAAMDNSDPLAVELMELFCHWMGVVAGNLAVTLGATGGVFIGGGIVPRLGEHFANSGFRAAFERKGRFSEYLADIPTYIIHADQPALSGAAQALDARFIRLGYRYVVD